MPTEYTGMASRDGTRVLQNDGEHCIKCGVLWPRDQKHDCPKDQPKVRAQKKTYLRFERLPTGAHRKTGIWLVLSLSSELALGVILWRGGWRQYVFEPDADTVWSDGCMTEVQTKIRELMEERKTR